MRTTKKSSNTVTRVISIAITFALILCAVLSFGYIYIPSGAKADGDDTSVTSVSELNGIKFVQVAAGEDFAIGLTYDGDLYGWSLRDNDYGSFQDGVESLGRYYSNIPTKINVVFRYGPSASNGYQEWSSTTNPPANMNSYHSVTTTEKIKEIAATRTTAAFITETGYIYTWGKDDAQNNEKVIPRNRGGVESSNYINYLLLRKDDDSTVGCNWYEPYIINYKYYNSAPTSQQINPAYGNQISNFSLAAGEYNYILLYTKGTGGNYYTYVWGSMMYSVSNTDTKDNNYDYSSTFTTDSQSAPLSEAADSHRVFNTGIAYSAGVSVSVVAGGYNVGYNSSTSTTGSTSLSLRGRNFLTSVGNKSNVVNTVNTVGEGASNIVKFDSTTSSNYTGLAQNGIIGGAGIRGAGNDYTYESGDGIMQYGSNTDKYYGRVASGGSALSFLGTRTVSISDAHSNLLAGSDNIQARIYGVSLGNDIGYGIGSSGSLYAWGDNSNGQLSSAFTGNNIAEDSYDKLHSATPKQINGDGSVLNGKSFVSVAAGKQLSADNKAFYYESTFTTDGEFDSSADGTVKNGNTFITGAITNEGELWVWSDKNNVPAQIKYGNAETPQSSDTFVAVYSGYGNNLFAITKSGKLIRVTYTATATGDDGEQTTVVVYNQERYDMFCDGERNTIVNWNVRNDNTVHFVNEDYGNSATFYVWSATMGDTNAATNAESLTSIASFNELVRVNNIGDAYRIMTGTENVDQAFLSPIISEVARPASFAPVYKYDDVVMTDKQQANMFGAEIVYDENKGVGIKITPKQSSKSKTIKIEFWIARYVSYDDVDTNGTLADSAQYYDFRPCTITFDIADTPTTLAFGKYSSSANNNSLIPLLDPNNDYNNTYSVAVQNVSEGVNELYRHFGNATPNANTAFVVDMANLMAAKDAGYPLAAKRNADKGNLDYYLGATAAANIYYNNKYQYLYEDRDADRVVLSSNIGGGTTAITPEIKTITVSFDVADYFSGITASDIRITQFLKDFDNKYGFHDIYFGPKGTADDSEEESAKTDTTITFSYDIVTFRATAATGNIVYDVPDDDTSYAPVSSYRASAENESSGVLLSVTPSVQTYDFNGTGANQYIPIPQQPTSDTTFTGSEVIAVFATPSLRMKTEFNTGKTDESDGIQINGSATSTAKNNVYTETYADTIYVGQSVTINLSKYFNNLNDRIKFSFENGATQNSYDEFNAQFNDETGSGVKIVELTSNSITISPTTTAPIRFTVVMQRFANGSNATFGNDEKIQATFIFDKSKIQDFTFATVANLTVNYTITKTETISLFGSEGSLNAGSPMINSVLSTNSSAQTNLMSKVVISTPVSSESVNDADRLFDVQRGADKKSFTVTPRRSGSGTVQFVASVYGKSLFFSININVSAKTVIDDTITVIDDQYIYIETFTNKLREANSFTSNINSYDLLYTDIVDPDAAQLDRKYNAIYFTADSVDGEKLTDPPAFIRNVIIQGVSADGIKTDTKPSLRIISANSSVDTSRTYYMHIQYINTVATSVSTYAEAPDGTILEAVIPVVSGKVVVNALSVDINCREPKSTDIYTITGSGVDTRVSVKVSGLLDSIGGIESSTEYTVSLVSADPEVSNYLNYSRGADGKSIVITPLYNTPEAGCEMSVSVSYGNDNKVLLFYVNVDGITTVLPVTTEDGIIGYGNIWLYSFIIVFGVLVIIFVVRMIVYWKKRSKQRALIKRNQELIRMRDRMHNKSSIATKEQIVKTKLKMDDPKYAKMFNDMRKSKEEESGVILENSELAATADAKVKKNKKKKGGKKSVAELKAELEAKKAAFAAAQAAGAQPVNPFAADVPPMDGADFVPPADDFGAQPIDGEAIVFDASDMGEGM